MQLYPRSSIYTSVTLFLNLSDIGNTWLVLDKVTAYKLIFFKLRMIIHLGMCQADILLCTRTLCLFWTSECQRISHPIQNCFVSNQFSQSFFCWSHLNLLWYFIVRVYSYPRILAIWGVEFSEYFYEMIIFLTSGTTQMKKIMHQ